MTEQNQASVDVKSAWSSKINWTQVVALGASVAVVAGCTKCDMPAETQVALVLAIQGVQSVMTWVMRTWFTRSITPGSV